VIKWETEVSCTALPNVLCVYADYEGVTFKSHLFARAACGLTLISLYGIYRNGLACYYAGFYERRSRCSEILREFALHHINIVETLPQQTPALVSLSHNRRLRAGNETVPNSSVTIPSSPSFALFLECNVVWQHQLWFDPTSWRQNLTDYKFHKAQPDRGSHAKMLQTRDFNSTWFLLSNRI
jgi:hypothetical protein